MKFLELLRPFIRLGFLLPIVPAEATPTEPSLLCERYYWNAVESMTDFATKDNPSHEILPLGVKGELNKILAEARKNADQETVDKIAIILIGHHQRQFARLIINFKGLSHLSFEEKLAGINSFLFEKFSKFEPSRSSFTTFSRTFVSNELKDLQEYHTRSARQIDQPKTAFSEWNHTSVSKRTPTPHRLVMEAEEAEIRNRRIYKALKNLEINYPKQHEAVLGLYGFNENEPAKTETQMAREKNVTRTAIRFRHQRAKMYLENQLTESGFDLEN